MNCMKTIRASTSHILGMLGALLILAGCSNPFNVPSAKVNVPTGNVTIEINGVGSAGNSGDGSTRTVHPDMSGLTYELSFEGPVMVANIAITGGSANVSLQQGSWTITAAARNGAASVASGSWTGVVGSDPVNVPITLAPVTGTDMTGTLSYTINGLANAQTATLSLMHFTSAETEGTAIDLNGEAAGTARNLQDIGADQDNLSLAAGMYLLNVQLVDSSGKVAGKTEAVHIYTGLSTAVSYGFSSFDFQAVIPLTADTWANGSLAADGQEWFSFTATAATQYIHVTFGTLTDLYVQLYDSAGAAVGSQTFMGNTGALFTTRTVTSGNVYYVRVTPYSSSYTGTYQIAFNSGFLPPGTTPTTLTADTWANGSLATDGQEWFSFTATAATQYIHVTFGTLTDLYVQLYDSAGAAVGSQTNLYGSALFTSRTVTSGNVYYVRVTPYSSSYTGTYQIMFSGGFLPPGATPTTLSADTWANGSLVSGGQEWYSFTATAATQYIHAAFGTLGALVVQLYDSAGAAVGDLTQLNGSNPFTTLTVTSGNVYYVRVTTDSTYTGTYQLAFNSGFLPPGATPTTLTANTWANGSLAAGGQEWYSFTATAATQYIHATFGTLPNLYVQLYDSAGAAVGSRTSLNGGSALSTSRTVTSGNVYYVRVTQFTYTTGTYQIAFNSSFPPPGTTPTTLTADTWANGSLAAGGQKWYSFTATAATQYIHVTFGTLTDLYVQLYDSAGAAVGGMTELSYNIMFISRTVTSGNVYYVRVRPYSSSYSGTYQIAFSGGFLPPGATPTTLTADTWANGSLAAGGQEWYSFTATAATQYIHATFGTLTDLLVQLYDSAGAAVGSQTRLSNSSAPATSRTVTSGNVYYVRVMSYPTYTGTYQIAFNASSTSP
ncbi:hypothetical protein AGMMS50293_04190 [Spirochaetia bacterium]|nr:hypothetical protein AGMMS50293_04190 [Spirochaetia bacterium]